MNAAERRARREAQRRADEKGRKVYLQFFCGSWVYGDDGRGPINLWQPWREFYPTPTHGEPPHGGA